MSTRPMLLLAPRRLLSFSISCLRRPQKLAWKHMARSLNLSRASLGYIEGLREEEGFGGFEEEVEQGFMVLT